MKRTVHITAEDIQKYHEDTSYTDPIQVALEREGFGRCTVTVTSFVTFTPDSLWDPMRTISLPLFAGERLKALQLGQEMKPFEFEIEL